MFYSIERGDRARPGTGPGLAIWLWSLQLEFGKRLRHGPLQRLLNALFRPHGPDGVLASTWPTGSMLLWVVVMLALLLVLGAFVV